MDLQVRVDASSVLDGLRDMERAIPFLNRAAAARIQSLIRDIVMESLEIALDEAGSGFPLQYANHLRSSIRYNLEPQVFDTADGLIAYYYDIESLGTQEDLIEGYHYHALEATDEKYSPSNRPLMELPFQGQDLKNDKAVRQGFFEAMANSVPYEVNYGSGFIKKKTKSPRPVQTAGLYDETINARVQFWLSIGSAPEWLILEYGSSDSFPRTPATHFRFMVEERVVEGVTALYEQMAEVLIDVWNSEGIRLNSADQLINKYGQYVKYLPT